MTDASALPGRPDDAVLDGPATERSCCLLAPNPSPMTLDGTNTWILAEPGSTAAVVVDPGPADEGHLRRVADTVAAAGRRVAMTLLTHGHADHTGGAPTFARLTGSPVRALDPRLRLGDEGLAGGDVIRVAGLEVEVVATPGHTADSLSFHIPADGALLTGDTVLGRGTTIIAHPDGRLGEYLDSLRRLREFTERAGLRTVLPGHGPVLRDPAGAIDYYLVHRAKRLAEVETAYEAGHRTASEIVAHVYADVDRSVWPAAELSVLAQLEYLREHGLVA
ncbi:MBL fold metallo-hydrolase [Streptomyces sp. 8K308]|uniref:MBL fold metallo-hydrolase n=1 Tax=Streptomyces sp. 8K308 TaxID=2530388 RepID=UPI00104CB760|nr:MBL fold metallo-hydrolase [Streptomyces sp. 8K308]TDC14969.1 MBL fold metallo-hydrolase [Streptomyces sp. 8K308]